MLQRKWFFLTDRVERWDDILNIEVGVEEMERLTGRAQGSRGRDRETSSLMLMVEETRVPEGRAQM